MVSDIEIPRHYRPFISTALHIASVSNQILTHWQFDEPFVYCIASDTGIISGSFKPGVYKHEVHIEVHYGL
jgi:hypothetical protein